MEQRRRNAIQTRAAILRAAHAAFAQHGFDGVGVREITRAAGVNVSLVNRYFGSKRRLFAEAMPGGADPQGLRTRTFRDIFGAAPQGGSIDIATFDPMIALIHSPPAKHVPHATSTPLEAGDDHERDAIARLVRLLDSDLAVTNASLVVALLAGIAVLRVVAKSEALASKTLCDLDALLDRTLLVEAPCTLQAGGR